MSERCDCGTLICRLDGLTKCRVRVICDAHDRQIIGASPLFRRPTADELERWKLTAEERRRVRRAAR